MCLDFPLLVLQMVSFLKTLESSGFVNVGLGCPEPDLKSWRGQHPAGCCHCRQTDSLPRNQNLKHEFYKSFFLHLLNYFITVNIISNLGKETYLDIIFTNVGFIIIGRIFIITNELSAESESKPGPVHFIHN